MEKSEIYTERMHLFDAKGRAALEDDDKKEADHLQRCEKFVAHLETQCREIGFEATRHFGETPIGVTVRFRKEPKAWLLFDNVREDACEKFGLRFS